MNKKEKSERLEEDMEIQPLPGMDKMDVLIETLRKLPIEDIENLRSALWLVGGVDINSPDYQADRPDFKKKYYFGKVEGEWRKVDVDTILYAEAKDNYVYLHYPSGKPTVLRTTLEGISRELPNHEYYRINRTHIITVKHVTAFTKEYVRMGDLQFPVSKVYADLLEWRCELLGTY